MKPASSRLAPFAGAGSFLGIGLFLLWGSLIEFFDILPPGADPALSQICKIAAPLVNGLCLITLAAMSQRKPTLLNGLAPLRIGAALGTVGIVCLLAACTIPAQVQAPAAVVGSICIGVSMAVMALIWMELYSTIGEHRVVPYYAVGLLVFALLGALINAPDSWLIRAGATLVLPTITMTLARRCARRTHEAEPLPEIVEQTTETRWTFPFKPVLLIAACAVSLRVAKTLGLALGYETHLPELGDALVACVVILYLLACGKPFDIRNLYRWSLPLCCASLLLGLCPIPGAQIVASIAGNAGFSCFTTLCMVLFCSMSYRFGINALWLFGISRSARVLAGLAGTVITNSLIGPDEGAHATIAVCTCLALIALFMGCLSEKDILTTWGTAPISTGLNNGEVSNSNRLAELSRAYGLTRREEEILTLLLQQFSVAQIEERLVISRGTVKVHLRHIYAKLGVHSREELEAVIGTA